jgi:hypothetical protein
VIEELAKQGADALFDFKSQDHDEFVKQLDSRDLARGALESRMLNRSRKEFDRLIAQSERANRLATQGGDALSELVDALRGTKFQGLESAAETLASIATKAGATPEQFGALVERLKLLRDLQGERAFDQLTKPLRARFNKFATADLARLTAKVGEELHRLAYKPLAVEWRRHKPNSS